ncbi:hypothetical protein EMIHUDRAFT_457875 [Emiliania huxleyi CCMP1516]|uniref:C2 domain-containing protein n=2 Tax=Emiliania huxleyi TaxID=2903 RepID=A0A0D3JJZ2_EMIH1|nr:hypothetical protein EMIHUDRAFT_457875 [Emiliania huxleyi CCMP1516]EOD23827.1 hypothetical protein EMIHUDRAFT_457875 [Emiliania huxleyi CCMP1516]|eukprot:XP_005776256.1 hypothetical protein EMIHUDRAFT_457875 [Emiliania huxleyi CCMP1516]
MCDSAISSVKSLFGAKDSRKNGREASQKEVTAATPGSLWFTPEAGWPKGAKWPGKAPRSLLPTREESPELFFLPPALGELRVEVLEAEGLKKSDTFSENDVFALVVFEGAAAVSSVLDNAAHPRWTPRHARAFKFSPRRPHSRLCVALFDEDMVGDDDPLGRAEIPLAALHPLTEYDVWMPLQKAPYTLHMRKYGRVRLRFSIQWYSETDRLLRYPAALSGSEPPHVLPFKQRRWSEAASFAANGPPLDKNFKMSVCVARFNELYEVVGVTSLATHALKSLVCYRDGNVLSSALVGLLWQLCCVKPNLLPSCGPLLLLAILSVKHAHSRAYMPGVMQTPSAWRIMRGMLPELPPVLPPPRGKRLPPLARPADDSGDELSDEDSDDERPPTYEEELEELVLMRDARAVKREKAKEEERKKAAAREARGEKLDDELATQGIAGALARQNSSLSKSKLQKVSEVVSLNNLDLKHLHDLNPIQRMLTAYLAPKQKRLGETLQSLRSLRGLFEWRDPLATWWLALLLAAAALVLALPPWQRIMQLLGAALFGPHMYFVGRMRAVQLAMGFDAETCSEALGTALEARFRHADSAGQRAMLEAALSKEEAEEAAAEVAEEKRKKAAYRKQLEREKLSAEQKRLRFAALARAGHPLVVPSHPLTFNKHFYELDPYNSRAYPTEDADAERKRKLAAEQAEREK